MHDNDEAPAARVGAVLDGAYRLIRLIAVGGMSTVYEATELRLDRRVAVKVMTAELAENPEGLARFRREVKITAKLAHPHIVQLLGFGTTETGRPYLVTEYLEGQVVETVLDRVGRMTLAEVRPILAQVASALTAIHAKGVVHRDLKPSNLLLLTVNGSPSFVKLLDFGVSKLQAANTQLTHAPSMLGTPEYMSPEQASGRSDDVDHRTDQWALAATLWRMLAGRAPFTGADLEELLYRIVNEEPPPLHLVSSELRPELERVLRRGLAKQRSNRYPTIAAFVRAFETAAGR
jgi:eukaryotic-like serine/threonine-protein kinase